MITSKRHLTRILLYIVIIALTLLPAVNILYIAATTGANNPSNDYLHTIKLIDQILGGDYSWIHYFRDTLEKNFHSFAILLLIRLIIIQITHGSVYAEIYTGYFFAVIKVILLYFLIAPGIHARFRLWLWPLLSALVFSTSQTAMFSYGIVALQLGLIQVGILGGLLGLTRRRGSWEGIIWMITGGVVACWSGGGGLISWPIFLVCLLLLKDRNITHYLAWGAGVLLGVWPYVAYGVLGNPGALANLSPERVKFTITAIGYPFLNKIGIGGLLESPPGFKIGIFGLGISLLGIALLWTQRSQAPNGWVVPILLMFWGVSNAIQTAASRWLLAPWYTTSFMPFWIGLAGLSLIFLTNINDIQTDLGSSNQTSRKLYITWAVIVLFSISVLYTATNLTYRDKSFHLASRSPASASCLRNYPTAPTYCEGLVFQWGTGNPTYLARLAWPLEKHQIYTFAPRQQWTVQGDYVLGRVTFNQGNAGSEIAWLDPRTNQPALWSDYHHLNLLLPAQNSVSWEIPLPPNASQATLSTALKAVSATSTNQELDGNILNISIEKPGDSPRLLHSQTLHPGQSRWQNISIPLTDYAGQTIKLVFELESTDSDPTSAILRYPVLNLNLNPVAHPTTEPLITPSNTDLSPAFPSPTSQDILLDTNIKNNWLVNGAVAVEGSEKAWNVEVDPAFTYQQPLDICINDYSKFYVRLGVSEDVIPRAAQVFYRLDYQTDIEPWQSFWLPLLADGSIHSYTYDLRLLSLPANSRITGIRLDPVINSAPDGKNLVEFEQVGFLHEPNSEIDGCDS